MSTGIEFARRTVAVYDRSVVKSLENVTVCITESVEKMHIPVQNPNGVVCDAPIVMKGGSAFLPIYNTVCSSCGLSNDQ